MKRLTTLFLLVLAALMLQSCVFCTGSSMAGSFRYCPEAVRTKEVWAPCCYRVGDACYLPVSVAFSSAGYYRLWIYVPGLSDATIHTGGTTLSVDTYYYRLSAEDAKLCTGLKLPEVPDDAPAYVSEDDWNAEAAVAVPLRRPVHEVETRGSHIYRLKLTEEKGGRLTASMPLPPCRKPLLSHLKWPLAAALFVGVDVPCTVVSTILFSPLLIADGCL